MITVVMDMFRLTPFDENETPPADEGADEDDELKDQLDDSTEDPDADADETQGDEESDDSDDDDGPVSRSKHDAEIAALNRTVADLKTAVGRAQALARQLSAGPKSEEILGQVREQNAVVAGLFEAIVDGIDSSAIDPALVAKIKQAGQEIRQADARAQLLAELREELGLSPQVEQERSEQAELQARANDLASFLEDEIVDRGLDPNDEAMFPWKEWANVFATEGERAARTMAMRAIRAAADGEAAGERREARRRASGRTPRGAAAGRTADPLTSNDFGKAYEELQKLLR